MPSQMTPPDADAFSGPASGPVAYITGEYPKVSHTFILREIAALRARGLEVHACTVRRAQPKDVVGADQEAEAARTFCVLDAAKAPNRLIGAHLEALMRSPRRWFAALGLAWRTRPPGLKAGLWQIFYFLEAAVLARHLRHVGATHLHNHFGDSSGTLAMLTSAMSGIPFSFTLHGPTIFFEPMKWRLDAKIARARFVVCISHFCRSQAMYFSDPAEWERLRIVHCGIDPAAYGRQPRNTPGRHVIFVGRLDPVKGVPLLLEAFAAAREGHPGARLTIVGDGPARAGLEARAKALGLGPGTVPGPGTGPGTEKEPAEGGAAFLGYRAQDEVAALLETADMLVLPSFAEGVPVVLMEAMASRLPVIASAVAGVPELVEDGVSGFVVPAGDLAALSERLARLLGDPALCRRMGEAGRARVVADYDIAAEAGRLARLFRGTDGGRLRPEPDEPVRPAES